MADPPAAPADSLASSVEWETLQDSPEFARLRHALRSFVFPVTAAFLVWYARTCCSPPTPATS